MKVSLPDVTSGLLKVRGETPYRKPQETSIHSRAKSTGLSGTGVRISPRAEKQLKNLPKLDQLAVVKKIRQIRDCEKVSKEERLQGFNQIYRVRIGDLRIIYQRKQQEIYIILIGQRKDIYQLVKRLFS